MKIELKSISLTYPGRTTVDSVLRDVNAEFGSGEFALVIGPSGSGKTSLLLLLGGLLGPTGGLILLDGESCGHWSRNERRLYRLRRVGFIFQSFRLIEALDVAHNVAMPLMIQGVGDRDALRLAIDTLESLGLDAKAGAPIRELSGGDPAPHGP